jgi:hypothetical protein
MVWVLALHGFSLLVCPQPLGRDNPHKEEIRSELIRQMYLGLVKGISQVEKSVLPHFLKILPSNLGL